MTARFTRTVDLYGVEAFARIRAGGVIVAGLGGVGAHCAVALARSGVGRLKLIDCDQITNSSLNRHPVAGPDDLGRRKTEILATFLGNTCPDTETATVDTRIDPKNLPQLVPATDRVSHAVLVDCIDSVQAKVALLGYGLDNGWQTLSSLGAAGKRDGGAVRTGTLADTRVCPLARKVRHGVRRLGEDPAAITAVWSEESPSPSVVVEPDQRPSDEPEVRRRQPSNMMLPGMFGFALATLALDVIADP